MPGLGFINETELGGIIAAAAASGSAVASFNARTGVVTLTSGDVTTALTFTPTSVTGLTGSQSVAAFKTGLTLVKGDVGLGSVDNTADSAKPVSTAQQTALDAKLDDSQATAFGLSLLDDADAAAGRTTLALGTLATQSGTFSGTSSGTNTGDQTSIVGITGTKAQFDTAVTDGNILYADALGVTVQAYDPQLADLSGLAYAGNTLKVVRVNAGETGFELAAAGSGGDLALNKHVLAANFTITADQASYVPRYLEIGATFALEIGAGADMEIG